MELSLSKSLAAPPIRALAAPVYWQPTPGSHERICAMILLAPELSTSVMLTPAAHVIITPRRLRQLLGNERGDSAAGILGFAAEFMTRRLHADSELSACLPPFAGFQVGKVKLVKGFTTEQVLDAAVRGFSIFGDAQNLLEDASPQMGNSTRTTREFLTRVQTAFAPSDDARRARFMRQVQVGEQSVTIDYAHNAHLVQFASAPTTDRQLQNMRREGEAKILEALTVQKSIGQQDESVNFQPRLIINTSPFFSVEQSPEAQDIERKGVAHYHAVAKLHNVATAEAANHEAAANALLALN